MKILMLSPYFAPCTIVPAMRMTSLAQYLNSQGHAVTVIKLAEASYDTGGLATGERLEGITYAELTSDIDDWTAINAELLCCIDTLCQSTLFDFCVATFGPFSTTPAIIAGTKKHHIPLVVDYRDLWCYHPRPPKTLKEKLVKWYVIVRYHELEKRLMESCVRFVSVTPRSVRCMVNHYHCLSTKAACIYNGYTTITESNLENENHIQTNIYVLGKLSYYSTQGTRAFFCGVQHLIKKGHPIRVVHIGKEEPLVSEMLREIQFPMDCFRAEGQHPYEETIAMARSADLFVAINRDPDGLETKIFDYIYLNKPIVAYGPPNSEFGELIANAENAFMCQTQEQMELAIEQVITEKLDCLTHDQSFCNRFSREEQNQRYYQLLQNLIKL